MNSAPQADPAALRALYMDLMKKCLTHSLWHETEDAAAAVPLAKRAKQAIKSIVGGGEEKSGKSIQDKVEGRIWPQFAHTMIGFPRLENLQKCVQSVIEENIPGDLIETGVWRGGACIFMRAILKAHGVTDRTVWVADSFQGLPPPNTAKAPADKQSDLHKFTELAIALETVQSHFRLYGLLDDQVKFLKGWFKDTLPTAPLGKLAVARLDGDMYESTMDALQALYPKLSVGGYLIVDDYGAVEACKQAVQDYRGKHDITEPITTIDWTGSFWRRER